MEKVNLQQKFALFSDYWKPRLVGELNNFAVKLVKIKGEFDWHHHDQEDELFFVMKGHLLMQIAGQPDILVDEGEFLIVPHGIEHRPVAEEETHIMLLEPTTTLNTGNITSERTVLHVESLE